MSAPGKSPRTLKATPACGNCLHAGPPVVCPGAVVRVKCQMEKRRCAEFAEGGAWKDTNGYCPFHEFRGRDGT